MSIGKPGLLLLALALSVLLVACGGQPASSPPATASAASTTKAVQATTAPTKAVQATANTLAATHGPAVLGAPLSAFIGMYGQPNDHTDVSAGSYHFQRLAGSNIDFLLVQTDLSDARALHTIESITVQSSDNPATPPITASTCARFLPADAHYKKQTVLTSSTGYDKIYSSASLAKAFPASAFTDANGNPTTAGLFDVQYLISAKNTIDACTLQVGTQQTI